MEETVAALWYRPPVSDLVLQLKFRSRLAAAPALGLLLSHRVASCVDAYPDALLPVPLPSGRLRARGYNQALEIARTVSRQLNIPLVPLSVVKRIRETPPQSALRHHQDRQRNVRGAFRVEDAFNRAPHIAIVDDVMTTGATVDALATALKRRGVRRVDAWICARAE